MPTNTTASTATVISALPFSDASIDLVGMVPDAFDQGYLWYKYVAASGDNVIGALAQKTTPSGTSNRPYIEFWTGDDPGSVTQYLNSASFTDGRLQIPVTAGTTYWIRVVLDLYSPPSPFTVDVTAYRFTDEAAAVGDILINSDEPGYPASLVDPATGEVKRFVQGICAGETADILPDGRMLFQDAAAGGLTLYGASFAQLAHIASVSGNVGGGNKTDRFYVLESVSTSRYIRAIEADGTVGTQWGPLGTASASFAPQLVAVSPDETIAYYTNAGSGGQIKRWDLVNDTGLTDLAGAVATFNLHGGSTSPGALQVMADGSIVAGYWTTALSDSKILRYDPSGTLLNTYTSLHLLDRVVLDYRDDSIFWVWSKPSYGTAAWRKIRASDGTVLSETTDGIEVQDGGAMKLRATETDREFGSPYSCPMLILAAVSGGGAFTTPTPAGPSEPCCCDETQPKKKPRPNTGMPASGSSVDRPLPSATGPIVGAVDPAGWTSDCTGGGTVPSAADPSDGESWVS